MDPAVRLPRVHPWIVVALVVALELLVIAAVLLAPSAIHAMSGVLHGPQQMAPICPGYGSPC